MIHIIMGNQSRIALFKLIKYNISRGLVVRIAASHPGDPGSIPGLGHFLVSFHFLPNFKALFWPSANFGEQKAFSP